MFLSSKLSSTSGDVQAYDAVMKFRFLLIPLLLIVFFGGCKSKPTLVGTWSGSAQVMGTSVDTEFDFSPDGKLAVKQSAKGQSSTQKGEYKEAEKSFTFKPLSIESPLINQEQAAKINAQIAAANKTVNFTVDWKDEDTINVTQQGDQSGMNITFTLKRKKS
jgi:hypothetical protein